MKVIYAEKQDMGAKIAAALGGVILPSRKCINLVSLSANMAEVKKVQEKYGYLKTMFKGEEVVVTWGFGHLYNLKDTFGYNPAFKKWSARPVCFIPAAYELQPVTSDVKRFAERNDFQRKKVAELFHKADLIINSTDDDREGEVIFAYVYEASKCKTPYVRVRFTSQTEKGIREAFDNLIPSSECKAIEYAGRARAIYDWLIGTNLTTQFTLKNPGHGVLSVGRVQTPVLKMIVDRELAIRSFSSSKFWTLKGEFTTSTGEKYTGEHKAKRFSSIADANAMLTKVEGSEGIVSFLEAKKSKKEVPLLYSQTVLQMDANDHFGFTPDKTLEISQWLYEQGYITYPRTKSQFLNDDMKDVVKSILVQLSNLPIYKPFLDGKALTPRDMFFDSSMVDSHFAIIPTEKIPTRLSPEQGNIYDLIAKSVIRTIYPAAIIENTVAHTTVNDEEFVSKGAVIVDPGWLVVGGKIKEDGLPKLAVGDIVEPTFEVKEGKTEPPKRYTDKTILAAMKSAGKDLEDEELKKILADPSVEGIGTDATRAEILKTLTAREYIYRKGKSIYATDKGIRFVQGFPVEDIKSPAFTAMMEQKLASIAAGKFSFDIFVQEVQVQTQEWCRFIFASASTMGPGTTSALASGSASSGVPAPEGTLSCPICGKPVYKRAWGWGCSGYSAGCPVSIRSEICGKKITEAQVKALLSKKSTRAISGFTTRAGKTFDAKLVLDATGKIKFEFINKPKTEDAPAPPAEKA